MKGDVGGQSGSCLALHSESRNDQHAVSRKRNWSRLLCKCVVAIFNSFKTQQKTENWTKISKSMWVFLPWPALWSAHKSVASPSWVDSSVSVRFLTFPLWSRENSTRTLIALFRIFLVAVDWHWLWVSGWSVSSLLPNLLFRVSSHNNSAIVCCRGTVDCRPKILFGYEECSYLLHAVIHFCEFGAPLKSNEASFAGRKSASAWCGG